MDLKLLLGVKKRKAVSECVHLKIYHAILMLELFDESVCKQTLVGGHRLGSGQKS